MNIKKNLLIFLSLIFLFLLGCSSNKSNEITFAIGGSPNEILCWEEIAKDFEIETGIKVNIQRQPTDTDQRRQGLVIPLQAKMNDPDVFLMDVAWIAQFAASNWLEKIDNNKFFPKIDLSVFFQNILNLADHYNNDLIALPVYIDGGLLYYRKDLLKKYNYKSPPETWNDLLNYSLNIQTEMRKENKNFYGFVWQGAQYEGLVCTFLEFSTSNNGGFKFEDKKILFNTKENKIAVQFMSDLIYKFKISPLNTFTEMKEEEVRIFFQQGNALFERN